MIPLICLVRVTAMISYVTVFCIFGRKLCQVIHPCLKAKLLQLVRVATVQVRDLMFFSYTHVVLTELMEIKGQGFRQRFPEGINGAALRCADGKITDLTV